MVVVRSEQGIDVSRRAEAKHPFRQRTRRFSPWSRLKLLVWACCWAGLPDAVAEPVSEATKAKFHNPVPDEAAFVERVRNQVLRDVETLPDLICIQRVDRFVDPSGSGRWYREDTLEGELSFQQGRERVSQLRVNGKPAGKSYEAMVGALTIGEFGSILRAVFARESQANFTLPDEPSHRLSDVRPLDFVVSAEHSSWTLSFSRSHSLRVPYEGRAFVQTAPGHVIRIFQRTRDLPNTFPITYSAVESEYGIRQIGDEEGREAFLPLRAEVVIWERTGRRSRNLIQFSDFKKFGAEVRLIPEAPGSGGGAGPN
ncbi:MAG: hypothetical protein AB1898_05575 [Acidobacteriota bacterium]